MAIDQTTEECIIEFRERRIDVTKIKNLKLARVFRERVHNGERFLFNYGDHTENHIDYKKSEYEDYSDHREYGDHVDHVDSHTDRQHYGDSHTDDNRHYADLYPPGYSDHEDYKEPGLHTDQHTDTNR